MTLDDTEGLLCSCFENTCIFGVHHEFLNEGTHIITSKTCRHSDSRAYKFYTDIHEGCVKTKRGIKRQCGCRQWQFPALSLVSSLESLQARPTLNNSKLRPVRVVNDVGKL